MTPPRLFVWVSQDAPDSPPGRREVAVCPTCRAWVEAKDIDRHAVSHRADRRKGA